MIFLMLMCIVWSHSAPRNSNNTYLWHMEFSCGCTKLERFLPKNQHTHRNYWILRIGLIGNCQKFGIILGSKWFKNWCYQKMSITRNVLLNWYSSMKKKIRKIPMIFESQILVLFDSSPLLQFSKFGNFIWIKLIFSQKPF